MFILRFLRLFIRVILYPILLWLVFASIWWQLPNPVPDIAVALRKGETRIQFYDKWDFYHYPERCSSVRVAGTGRNTYIALDYQLLTDSSGAPSILSISGQRNVSLNPAQPEHDRLSEAFVVKSRTGYYLDVPRFPEGDSIELSRWIFTSEEIDVPLRIQYGQSPHPSSHLYGGMTFDIIPDHGFYHNELDVKPAHRPMLHVGVNPQSHLEISVPPVSGEENVHLRSPSRMFVLRTCLLVYLAPLAVVGIFTFIVTSAIIRGVCAIIWGLLLFWAAILVIAAISFVLFGLCWWNNHDRPAVPVRETLDSVRTLVQNQIAKVMQEAREKAESMRAENEVKTSVPRDIEAQSSGEGMEKLTPPS